MVICKFFLQGTCKFGDFCKFEHQLNDNYHYNKNSTSVLRQSQFGNIQEQQQLKQPTNPSNVDTNTLIKAVVNDMTGAEKGGQWLLSCYAPYKEKPAFPGFEDYSSEEIRLGYYDALKNGSVEQYKQQVQSLLQEAVMKIRSLQAPSPDIVNLLKSIYNTPPASHCAVYGSNTASTTTAFANPVNLTNTSGAFGQQQQTNFVQQPNSSIFPQPNQNIYGKLPQPQNQFGTTSNSIFGGTLQNNQAFGQANNSIFANAQIQTPTTTNIFRQANSSFVPQSNNPIFSGQSPTTQANSSGMIFAVGQPAGGSNFVGQQTSPPPNASIFRAQQNPSSTFGTQPQMQTNAGNIFGNSFAPQNTNAAFAPNIFAAPNTQGNQTFAAAAVPQHTAANVFRMANTQPLSQTPMFAQQQQRSVFGQQNVGAAFNQQNSAAFSQPPSAVADAKSHSASIFGGGQNSAASNPAFGQVQQVDGTVYSKLEELTEDEVKWFQSDDLDILKIPERPPTYEMCFQV